MSGSPVPHWMHAPRILQHKVGAPISSGHGQQWCDAAAFLLGKVVSPVINCSRITGVSLATLSTDLVYYFAYAPSPGAQVLRFEIECWNYSLQTVTVSLAGALSGATWIRAGGLDGSSPISGSPSNLLGPSATAGYLDISACTKNAIGTVTITVSDVGQSQGLKRLCVHEMPLASLDPVGSTTLEAGIDPDWPSHGNQGRLIDGASTSPRGTYRVWSQMEAARKKVRRHLQFIQGAQNGIAPFWSVTGTSFANPFVQSPILTLRARRLYGTSASNTYRAVVTYKTTDTDNAEIRFGVTPLAGVNTNTDLVLAGSTSWTTIDAGTVSVPCSGTLQEAFAIITARHTVGGKSVYLAHVGLIEQES